MKHFGTEDDPLLNSQTYEKLHYGHPLKDWIVLGTLTGVTILLIIILAAVLPAYSGPHPCMHNAQTLVARVQRGDTSKAQDRIKMLINRFGARPAGQDQLEKAIDWIVTEMRHDNLTAHLDPVVVPHWVRGAEEGRATVGNYTRKVRVLGLTGTVSGQVNGTLVVVTAYDNLTKALVDGKIVLFNNPWVDEFVAEDFYRRGPTEAAKLGARGVLFRSPSPFSMANLHGGAVRYIAGVPHIPCATITADDAASFYWLYQHHQAVNFTLDLQNKVFKNVTSHNILTQVEGRSKSSEVVVIGAYIDSLDVGTGVQDGLSGFIMGWEALRVMRYHGIIPARTVRLVGWTGHETGGQGAMAYANTYSGQTVIALEANRGSSMVTGLKTSLLGHGGVERAVADVAELVKIIENAGHLQEVTTRGTRSGLVPLMEHGVPSASFKTVDGDTKFLWYSRSEADTGSTLHQGDLAHAGGIMAAYAFCLADTHEHLGRG